MPYEEMDVFLQWFSKNPQWTIWLWIDKATTQNLQLRYQNCLNERARSHNLTVEVIECNQRPNNDATCKIFLKDISEEEVVDHLIRYEIDRLTPNYSASSDMLRYKILHKYGGAYFDIDVLPGENPLPLNLENKSGHLHFLDYHSQKATRNIPPHELNEKPLQPLDGIGNDIFLCTTNNPILEKFCELTTENYSLQNSNLLNRVRRTHAYYDAFISWWKRLQHCSGFADLEDFSSNWIIQYLHCSTKDQSYCQKIIDSIPPRIRQLMECIDHFSNQETARGFFENAIQQINIMKHALNNSDLLPSLLPPSSQSPCLAM